MDQNERLSRLEKSVDFLRVYTEFLNTKQSAMNHTILKTVKEKFPEIYSEFYSLYVNALDAVFEANFEGMEESLYEENSSYLNELRFKRFKDSRSLKEDIAYHQK